MSTSTKPFTAENITIKAVDQAAYAISDAISEMNRLHDLTEELWIDSQYGLQSPEQAAVLMNEYAAKLDGIIANLRAAFQR